MEEGRPEAIRSQGERVSCGDRKAAQAYERERPRREREEAKEEAARQKKRERRQQAFGKAKALDRAEEEHTQRVAAAALRRARDKPDNCNSELTPSPDMLRTCRNRRE
jgi:hypothetical protein